MRLGELLGDATRRLRAAASPSPRLDAELLLGHVTGWQRAALLAHPEWDVAPDVAAAFEALVRRRAAAEPIAYLTGQREFFGHVFRVDRRALIPRPETELLVELGIAAVARLRGGGIEPRVVEVGTGSGAVAISLAIACGVDVVATDVAWPALSLARENAVHLLGAAQAQVDAGPADPFARTHASEAGGRGVAEGGMRPGATPRAAEGEARENRPRLGGTPRGTERAPGDVVAGRDARAPRASTSRAAWRAGQQHTPRRELPALDAQHGGLAAGPSRGRVRLAQADLLAGLGEPLHVVLANLPYVPSGRPLPPDVREYEPPVAIFGGPRGTELIERLLRQARPLLAAGGEVCVELDEEEQARPIAALARALFADSPGPGSAEVCVCRDAGGYDRVVRIQRA